ncbi:hypothetical protein [Rhizobium mongolense]|uniref:hypothetical protein n=1 Tax=Rhizobium mongolense TaxID=57676 RepID=UPI0034A544F6
MHNKQRDVEFGGRKRRFCKENPFGCHGLCRRIVTKVLLFVVPLVVLIAGVGEQSTGIQDVSRAVRDVELVTQQNAAMVEENNASITPAPAPRHAFGQDRAVPDA